MNTLLIALSVLGQVAADRLLVASYGNETHAGSIQTLEVLSSTSENSSHVMKIAQENHECGTLPTWLDVSLGLDRIVCLDESATNASLTMLGLGHNGSLRKVSSSSVLGGAVSMASYNNRSALALAHVRTISLTNSSLITYLLCDTFNSTVPSQPFHYLLSTGTTLFRLCKTLPSRRRSRFIKRSSILRSNI
jgi:hypothetical protein